MGYLFYVIYKRQKKSNLKLNLFIYSGLDEREIDNIKTLNILCNIRVWFLVISFTLIFTPMFAKTYKLSRIFTELLITKSIPGSELLIRVGYALLIDLILLIIFTSLHP